MANLITLLLCAFTLACAQQCPTSCFDDAVTRETCKETLETGNLVYPQESSCYPGQVYKPCTEASCEQELNGEPYRKYQCQAIGTWGRPGTCVSILEANGPCPPKRLNCYCNCTNPNGTCQFNDAETRHLCRNNYAEYPPDFPHYTGEILKFCGPETTNAYCEQSCKNLGWWQQEGYCAINYERFGPCPIQMLYCYCDCNPTRKTGALRGVPPHITEMNNIKSSAQPFIPAHLQTGEHFTGQLYSRSNSTLLKDAMSVIAVWRAMKPDIYFETVWELDTVNSYGWSLGGKSGVIIYGGLMRHKLLGWEGLSLVIARMVGLVAPLTGNWTHDGNLPGLSCARFADWSTAVHLMSWSSTHQHGMTPFYMDFARPTIGKVGSFLASLPQPIRPHEQPEHINEDQYAQRTPCNLHRFISATCRKDTMMAGLYAEDVPDCWGISEESCPFGEVLNAL